MKQAQTVNGTPISATARAPRQAICPHCGDEVILRHRRLMDGGTVYFWRHKSNSNLKCSGRVRPLG